MFENNCISIDGIKGERVETLSPMRHLFDYCKAGLTNLPEVGTIDQLGTEPFKAQLNSEEQCHQRNTPHQERHGAFDTVNEGKTERDEPAHMDARLIHRQPMQITVFIATQGEDEMDDLVSEEDDDPVSDHPNEAEVKGGEVWQHDDLELVVVGTSHIKKERC